MIHPTPADDMRRAAFAWLRGHVKPDKPYGPGTPDGRARYTDAPELFRSLDTFRASIRPTTRADLRDEEWRKTLNGLRGLDLRVYDDMQLPPEAWAAIAMNSRWHAVKKNLVRFARLGVYDVPGATEALAGILRDEVTKPGVMAMPYDVLSAWTEIRDKPEIPMEIKLALQDALDKIVQNVPVMKDTAVFVDLSGSMKAPVSGQRAVSSKLSCRDVAATMAACILARNPKTAVFGFHTTVEIPVLNPRDSVMTNVEKIQALPDGGTDCASTILFLRENAKNFENVIIFSDNESWFVNRIQQYWGAERVATGGSSLMQEWEQYRRGHPERRLVVCDLTPTGDSQAIDRPDILNVGGFSDVVFSLIGEFFAGQLGPEHWVGAIESISLAEGLDGTTEADLL